jgi:MFS family permease
MTSSDTHRTSLAMSASLALPVLLSSLGTSSVNVALPALMQAFDVPFDVIQWVVLTYLLALTASAIGVGRLGDMYGRQRLLMMGHVLFAVASLLCALTPVLWGLIVARLLQGLGAAMMMSMAMAMVADVMPREESGRTMGMLATMSATGTALGPSLGGVLLALFGWQSLFMVGVLPALMGVWLVYRCLPTPPGTIQSARFDYAGAGLLTMLLAAMALLMTSGVRYSWMMLCVLLLVVVFCGIGFVQIQRRSSSPLIQLGMLRDVVLRYGCIMILLISAVMMTTLIVGPFYLLRVLHLTTIEAGLVLAVGPMVTACVGIPAGNLVDRYGAKKMMIAGLCLLVAGTMSVAVLASVLSLVGYLLALITITAGYATFQTANNTTVMAIATPQTRGVVSGLLNVARHLGLMAGASAIGAVFALAAHGDVTNASAQLVAHATSVAFAVAAICCALALCMGLAIRRT